MAHIGMKYPVATELEKVENGKAIYVNSEGASAEAGEGIVVGKAISFTGTPNKNDTTLYADDAAAETDKTQRDWGVSLNVDDLLLEIQAKLLGHKYIPQASDLGEDLAEVKPEQMVIGTDDVAPFFGVGFYKRRRKNNVTTFTGIWLYKVQFSEPTENAETKGESVNFQTPTIEGTAYPVELGEGDDIRLVIGEKYVFSKEADVRKWLDSKIKKKDPLASLEVAAESETAKAYDKPVSDLQKNIRIVDNVVYGTLKYVEGYTGFSAEDNTGNFLALKVDYPEDATVKFTVEGGTTKDKEFPKGDHQLVVKVKDAKAQKIKLTITHKEKTGTITYDLSGLTLAEAV